MGLPNGCFGLPNSGKISKIPKEISDEMNAF